MRQRSFNMQLAIRQLQHGNTSRHHVHCMLAPSAAPITHLQFMLFCCPVPFVKPPELLAVFVVQRAPGVVQHAGLPLHPVMGWLGYQLALGRGFMLQLDAVFLNRDAPSIHLTHPTCTMVTAQKRCMRREHPATAEHACIQQKMQYLSLIHSR